MLYLVQQNNKQMFLYIYIRRDKFNRFNQGLEGRMNVPKSDTRGQSNVTRRPAVQEGPLDLELFY